VGRVRVAVIGGTGRFGSALVRALAEAGHHTIIGSRSAERAVNMAAVLGAQTQSAAVVEGALNPDAARAAEVVLLAVPGPGQARVVQSIADASGGRVVVDTCVCHHPRRPGVWSRPRDGSAAARVRRLLPRSAAVAATLHAVPASALRHPERFPLGHVLFCAEDQGGTDGVRSLLEALRLEGLPAGGLEVAAALEHLAVLLTAFSETHGAPAAGVRFLGLLQPPQR
jgi:hypothetical protein